MLISKVTLNPHHLFVSCVSFVVNPLMADPQTVSRTITLDSREEAVILFGPRDQYLRMIRDGVGVRVVARGDTLQLEGIETAVEQAERAFGQLRQVLRRHGKLTPEDVRTVIEVPYPGG